MSRPDLVDVLAEVNVIRATRNLPPLKAMPKGEQHRPVTCPVGRALETPCGATFWREPGEPWIKHPLPPVVSQFVLAFDWGEYPELIL